MGAIKIEENYTVELIGIVYDAPINNGNFMLRKICRYCNTYIDCPDPDIINNWSCLCENNLSRNILYVEPKQEPN